MQKITLKLDCWLNDELKNYLMELNGISKVTIDKDKDVIDIAYDSTLTNVFIIKNEIEIFLKIEKTPSFVMFDKHSKEITKNYEILIKDLCCEYCLKGFIEELLLKDGIEKVSSDFDYINLNNVKININYNDKILSEKDILQLESKFNS